MPGITSLIDGFLGGLRFPDLRELPEWAEDNVYIPHGDTQGTYRKASNPMMVPILRALSDPNVEKVTMIKATQFGGNATAEVATVRWTSDAPGNILITCQSEDDARDFFEDRLKRTLEQSPATKPLMVGAGRYGIKSKKITLANMYILAQGPGEKSRHSKTIKYNIVDEAWLAPPGLLAALWERQSRVAIKKFLTISQAGEEIRDSQGNQRMDQLGEWYYRSTMEVGHWTCSNPKCGCIIPAQLSSINADGEKLYHIKWDTTPETRHPVTKKWNWNNLLPTIRMVCHSCGTELEDTDANRWMMAENGVFVQTNPNPEPKHRGFQVSAWLAPWQTWGNLVTQFLTAEEDRRKGQYEAFKIWVQAKESRFYMLADRDVPSELKRVLWDYKQSQYKDGTAWENPDVLHRFMASDFQKDSFKVVIRDFAVGGASRLIYQGTLRTWTEVAQKAAHYRLPASHVMIDAGNWDEEVFRECAKRGWVGLKGQDINSWQHTIKKRGVRKPYRPPYEARGTVQRKSENGGRKAVVKNCQCVEWSNLYYKDWMIQLVHGNGVQWQIPDDACPEYNKSLDSEKRVTKNGKAIWLKIGGRQDHFRDAELMILVRADMKGDIFVSTPEPQPDCVNDTAMD